MYSLKFTDYTSVKSETSAGVHNRNISKILQILFCIFLKLNYSVLNGIFPIVPYNVGIFFQKTLPISQGVLSECQPLKILDLNQL